MNALVAALATVLALAAPAAAHHGHNHHGQGHRHDASGNLVIQSPGHCKHHPHACASTTVTASEPLTLGLLAGALLLRRRRS